MKQELKIVMTSGEDNGLLTTPNTVVSINDTPIGSLQNIKIIAEAGEISPIVELTFPDLKTLPQYTSTLTNDINAYIEKLSKIRNIKIILKDMRTLDEIGTDGHIENITTP